MEPFKAEEARRVRADGHIIKPFEASELLAALTRLEDRIIPQAEPSRARKPKPEKKTKGPRSAFDPAMSFDDVHSEKIAYLEEVKQRHASGEPIDEATEGFAEAETGQSANPTEKQTAAAQTMARPMSVYAAEALRELPVVAEPAPAVSEEQLNFQESSGFSNNAASEETAENAVTQSAELAEQRNAENSELPATEAEQAVSADESSATARPAASSPENELGESLVRESLLIEPPPELPPSVQSELSEQCRVAASPEQTADTADVPDPAPVVAKSRWVAENVVVSAEEAALELEREMQQTQAVAIVDGSSSQYQEDSAVPAGQKSQESATQPASTVAEEVTPIEGPSESNGATFAAAASASGSSSEAIANSPVSSYSSDPEPHAGSESAAAWENWRHIRDSVMGSQTAVQLSEAVAESVQGTGAEAVATHSSNGEHARAGEPAPQQNLEPQADGDSDNADLSSIVDSMLAELKPRLMAEIAKKLKK
jgi:hypothetical protein